MAQVVKMPHDALEPPDDVEQKFSLGTVLSYSSGRRYQLLRNTGVEKIGPGQLFILVQGYGVAPMTAPLALKGTPSYGNRPLELGNLAPGERGWFFVAGDHE